MISPAKSELDSFISGIDATLAASKAATQGAADTISGAVAEVGQLEYYKQVIMDLNDQESLNEWQKYQLKAAVDALSGSIPELAGAYDDETGKIKLQTEAIEDLITARQEQIITDAKAKAESEAVEALYKAELAKAQAQAAYDAKYAEYNAAAAKAADGGMFWQEEAARLNSELNGLDRTLHEASKQAQYAEQDYQSMSASMDEATASTIAATQAAYNEKKANEEAARQQREEEEARKGSAEATEKAAEALIPYSNETMNAAKAGEELTLANQNGLGAMMGMSDAAKMAANSAIEYKASATSLIDTLLEMTHLKDIGSAIGGFLSNSVDEMQKEVWHLSDIMTDAEKTVTDGWNALKEQAKQKISFSISAEFEGGDDLTTEKMNANIQSQIDGYRQYYENMTKLRELVAEGIITPEFYANMAEQGTSAANEVQHMVWTIENQGEYGEEQLRSLSEGYMEAMNWQDTIAAMLAGDAAAFSEGLKSLGSSDAEFDSLKTSIQRGLSGASDEQRSQIDQLVADAQELGVKIPEGLQSGIESGDIDAEGVINQLSNSITGTVAGLEEVAKENGIAVPEGLAEGILSGEITAQQAYATLMSAISQGTGGTDAASSGHDAGAEVAEGTAAGITESVGTVEAAAQSIVDSAAGAVQSAASAFTTAGTEGAAAFVSGLTGQVSSAQSAGQQLANSVTNALHAGTGAANSAGSALGNAAIVGAAGKVGSFTSIGSMMASGMASGIMARAGSIASAAAAVVSSALAAARAAASFLARSAARSARRRAFWPFS